MEALDELVDPPPLLFLISVPICISLSVVETGNLLDSLSAFLRKLEIDNIFFFQAEVSVIMFLEYIFLFNFLFILDYYLGSSGEWLEFSSSRCY